MLEWSYPPLMFPEINTNKQCYLGSGHTILKWSIRKNVLFQMYFLDNVNKMFSVLYFVIKDIVLTKSGIVCQT